MVRLMHKTRLISRSVVKWRVVTAQTAVETDSVVRTLQNLTLIKIWILENGFLMIILSSKIRKKL